MVFDIEPSGRQERSDFFGDESLESVARLEVGDDAALDTHRMVVMVRDGFGQLVSFATTGTCHTAHHTGIHHLGKVAVGRALGHTRTLHHFVGGERTIAVFERPEHCPPMSSEFQFANGEHLQHCRCSGWAEHRGRNGRSGTGHSQMVPAFSVEWEWFLPN